MWVGDLYFVARSQNVFPSFGRSAAFLGVSKGNAFEEDESVVGHRKSAS